MIRMSLVRSSSGAGRDGLGGLAQVAEGQTGCRAIAEIWMDQGAARQGRQAASGMKEWCRQTSLTLS